MTLNTPNQQKQREKMKTDSTSATLILSSKIRMVFLLVLGIFLLKSTPIQSREIQVNSEFLMTPQALKNIPNEKRKIIDTRSRIKYLMGHIPGAVNLNNWKNFTTKKNGVKGLLFVDKEVISHLLGNMGLNPTKSIIIYGIVS